MDGVRSSHAQCPTCSCATGGVIRWRPVVAILLGVAAWDVVGLAVGDRLYASPGYDALRGFAQVFHIGVFAPGMRLYAVGLVVLVVPLTYALLAQQRRNGTTSRLLSFTLSGLAGWWAAWCVGIAMSYLEHGQVYAWGGLGKLLGVSAVAILAARVPPPPVVVRQGRHRRPESG